jgi:hypothetical protein
MRLGSFVKVYNFPVKLKKDGPGGIFRGRPRMQYFDIKAVIFICYNPLSSRIHDDSSIVYSALGSNEGIRSKVMTWDGDEVLITQ